MALNIKDAETEQLAAAVAALASETKTRAINVALRERLERLTAASDAARRQERLGRVLVDEIWPQIPVEFHGRHLTKKERERILGYGRAGV